MLSAACAFSALIVIVSNNNNNNNNINNCINNNNGNKSQKFGIANNNRSSHTDTITGVSRYLKEKNPAIQIVGAQPEEGSSIPGIRKWPQAYLPRIYQHALVDRIEYVDQAQAETMARRLAAEEGIFCGISAAGACIIAHRIAEQVENATIVFVVCDRGDRYLSTGVFPG